MQVDRTWNLLKRTFSMLLEIQTGQKIVNIRFQLLCFNQKFLNEPTRLWLMKFMVLERRKRTIVYRKRCFLNSNLFVLFICITLIIFPWKKIRRPNKIRVKTLKNLYYRAWNKLRAPTLFIIRVFKMMLRKLIMKRRLIRGTLHGTITTFLRLPTMCKTSGILQVRVLWLLKISLMIKWIAMI